MYFGSKPQPADPLTAEDPAARSLRIKSLFSKLDTRRSGRIDRSDLVHTFRQLSSTHRIQTGGNRLASGPSPVSPASPAPPVPPVSPNSTVESAPFELYADELIALCDQTKNGSIGLAEFTKFVERKELELWGLFKQIDTSQDHIIQPYELKKALHASGICVTDDELDVFISHIDKNRDGVIDFDDWRNFLILLPHHPTLDNIFSYYINMFDVDFNTDSDVSFPQCHDESQTIANRLKYFLAGGIAGAVSRTATAPLDRLKVLLMTRTKPDAPKGHIIDGMIKIYRDGGLVSFYRGNGLNVLKIFPESAFKFFVFEYAKGWISHLQGHDRKDEIGILGRFVAGGLGGLVSQFAIYPLELLKTRMMAQISHGVETTASQAASAAHVAPPPKRIGAVAMTRQMWNEGGIKLFYRGCIPSLIGIVPYAGIDLCVFETLKMGYTHYLRNLPGSTGEERPSMVSILVFGMVSGSCGAVVMYPLSVIRTRLQAQGTPSHPQRYTGAFDAVRYTYRNEGVRGFYKGLVPTLLKVVPAVSISYLVYERSKVALGVA
ncbi:mitochondrial carrier domain-containing protein [Polychytrium aggregatum]|uniref:mitochondrial carrier domain-containing protein n=1 Tax=Polychytrium aggregatum TaxID=110093 RepID=UPI0022FEEDD9|nr:mitochondrial carrier domain-containing protein [Polychytrium aggregatum]KAI9203543.1 mitochondrial carrier domain-containing protein [Polychytrium aggregatum]